MIQEFSVKNFLSIRDKVTISFLPKKQYNSDSSSHLIINVNDQTQLLKSAILYGANASGKTNILNAFSYIQYILTDDSKNKEDIMGFYPFAFDDTSKNEPGYFELIFYIDGIKYWYEVEVNEKRILNEKLVYYPFKKPAKVYKRVADKISFGESLNLSKYDKAVLKGNTLSNISVIAAVGKTNIANDVFNSVHHYMTQTHLQMITPRTDLRTQAMIQIGKMDEKEKNIILTLLNQADFNIKHIEVKAYEHLVDKQQRVELLKISESPEGNFYNSSMDEIIEHKTLEYVHAISGVEKRLKDMFESNGTKRYLGLSSVLYKLIKESHFLAIDELETSLHPDLLLHFYATFLVNSKKSQIIFTTHNQTLLESGFIRKDILYFCEKVKDYGFTVVNRGSDFGIHKNNSIANFYKIGKLGGVPELGSVQLFDVNGECLID